MSSSASSWFTLLSIGHFAREAFDSCNLLPASIAVEPDPEMCTTLYLLPAGSTEVKLLAKWHELHTLQYITSIQDSRCHGSIFCDRQELTAVTGSRSPTCLTVKCPEI
jgi:hypothetical protein